MVNTDKFRDYLYGKYEGEISKERIGVFLEKYNGNIETYMNRRGFEALDSKVAFRYVEQNLEQEFAIGLKEEIRNTLTKKEVAAQTQEARERARVAEKGVREEQRKLAELRPKVVKMGEALAAAHQRYKQIESLVFPNADAEMARFESIGKNEKQLAKLEADYRAAGYDVTRQVLHPAMNVELTVLTINRDGKPFARVENTEQGQLRVTQMLGYNPGPAALVPDMASARMKMDDLIKPRKPELALR